MARFKAILEYDGTDFLGYQIQAQGRTVQGELEKALARLNADRPVTAYAAGRTDSGVHASGQVVAFDLPAWRHGLETLERALNAHLPFDVAVRGLQVAPDDYHPRFAARGRRYEYKIYNAPVRSPLHARSSWHVWPRLDAGAMQVAAGTLVGAHDFATFGTPPDKARGRPGGSTVRTVRQATWRVADRMLVFTIEADAFLYRMVRSIVGTLRRVGAGEVSPLEFAQMLAAADRKQAAPPAPPQGLCLVEVLF